MGKKNDNMFTFVLVMAALMGWLPIAITAGLAQLALSSGAEKWNDASFAVLFTALYFVLLGIGTYIFIKRFN